MRDTDDINFSICIIAAIFPFLLLLNLNLNDHPSYLNAATEIRILWSLDAHMMAWLIAISSRISFPQYLGAFQDLFVAIQEID